MIKVTESHDNEHKEPISLPSPNHVWNLLDNNVKKKTTAAGSISDSGVFISGTKEISTPIEVGDKRESTNTAET